MPGMMDTVLNLGLNDETIKGLIEQTGNERFAYDAYRRLVMMYADVVMEKAAGIEPKGGKGIRRVLEDILEDVKHKHGYQIDTELTADDLKHLVSVFKRKVKETLGQAFPEDPIDQLWGGIGAVFGSWQGKRAVEYRRIEKFLMNGVQLSMCRLWYLEIWVAIVLPELPLPEIQAQVMIILRRIFDQCTRRRRRGRYQDTVSDK